MAQVQREQPATLLHRSSRSSPWHASRSRRSPSLAAIVVSTLSRPPIGSSVGADVDPFLTPLAIEFRAGERAGSVAASVSPDPLLTQQAIDFRADERAASH